MRADSSPVGSRSVLPGKPPAVRGAAAPAAGRSPPRASTIVMCQVWALTARAVTRCNIGYHRVPREAQEVTGTGSFLLWALLCLPNFRWGLDSDGAHIDSPVGHLRVPSEAGDPFSSCWTPVPPRTLSPLSLSFSTCPVKSCLGVPRFQMFAA